MNLRRTSGGLSRRPLVARGRTITVDVTDLPKGSTSWTYDSPIPAGEESFGIGKSTAREMAKIMEVIGRCDLQDPDYCTRMVDIMRNQQFRYMIPRYLETEDTSEEGSAIADKIGELDHVRNDVALIETKAGPIVISVFTWDNADASWSPDNEAYFTIAKIAREIVHAWSPQGMGKAK